MDKFEFIGYKETPGEKHLGIATVKAYGKIILRFKVLTAKTGALFCAPSSYKIVDYGEERYIPCFTVDSVSENDELVHMITSNVNRLLKDRSCASAVSPQKMEKPSFNDELPF